MPIRVVCKKCGKTLQTSDAAAGKRGKCPKCGETFVVPAAGGKSSQASGRSRRKRTPKDEQSVEDPESGQSRRRRRRRAPDDDAPERRRRRKRSSSDEPSPQDMDNLFAGLGAGAEMGPEVDDPSDTNREPCPACGGMIKKKAAKCRFCGEIFDSVLKRKQRNQQVIDEDANLQAGDWVVGILCSGIGCITSIIWMIQGKPKGLKMFALSMGMQIFWVVVRVIVELTLLAV